MSNQTFLGIPFPLSYLSTYRWDPERLERVLALFAANPDELGRLIVEDEKEFGTTWSFDRLRQFPVIRTPGHVQVLSPRLLLERVFGWLPVFDVVDGFEKAGTRERGDRARQFFREVCERQVQESLAAIAGDGNAKRLYNEGDLRAAFGRKRKVADAVFDGGGVWIVAEVSTRQLQRGSRVGDSAEALAADLENGVYVKAQQIDSTIEALVADESRLTGAPAMVGRRFVPLLVATEGFPVNPMTTHAIQAELARRKLLQGPMVGALRIIDQEELYMAESIAEAGQASLLTLLEEWGNSGLRAMDMKSWLYTTRYEASLPQRLDPAFRAALHPAFRALGVDPDAPDEASAG